jgi:hypothetical protein
MRPTDKLGTFNSTSGGVDVDADAGAEEIVDAILEEDVRVALVDGMPGEELVRAVDAQSPSEMRERNPKETTRARRINGEGIAAISEVRTSVR